MYNQEGDSTNDRKLGVVVLLADDACEAHISQLGLAVAGEQNVGRLEVQVHNPLAVQEV